MKKLIQIVICFGLLLNFVLTSCSGGEGNPLLSGNKVTISLTNQVYTELYVEVYEDNEDFTILDSDYLEPGDFIEFEVDKGEDEIWVYAYTSGELDDGTEIGESIQWDFPPDFDDDGDYETDLIIAANFFFLRIQNTGGTAIRPLEVNPTSSEPYYCYDDIYIPNDDVLYDIGYYYNLSYSGLGNTQIKAYYDGLYPNNWGEWNQGTNLNIDNTSDNQVAELLFNLGLGKAAAPISFSETASKLRPARIHNNYKSSSSKHTVAGQIKISDRRRPE